MTCIFCAIASGEIPANRVAEDEVGVAFLDAKPKSPGHTLVVPFEHVSDLGDGSEVFVRMAPFVTRVAQQVVDKLGADGVNLVVNSGAIAGQEVFHLHVHVIPRYADPDAVPSSVDGVLEALRA
ncbi:HIT family protein [Propionibacteriaceae bacterium G1746]|uniref:HIT family protein n=1 Tax=Aestuariimicrobium sp. G57 TaxID=3418485 RepID=UPI003C21D566